MDNLQIQPLLFRSKVTLLEQGDENEITKIAKLARISYPSPDVKFFKAIFLMTDVENLNGCTLPDEEVIKALPSIIGKAVDLEHIRTQVVGHLDAYEKEGNQVIVWGHVWVSNFIEESDELLNDFKQGVLDVSFEAWASREFINEKSYHLHDIHFCGVGLLRDGVQPAFPGAKVLEFAKLRYNQDVELVTGKPYQKAKTTYKCECIECGYKVTSTKHCKDLTCSKCGGQMRREERPGPGKGEEEARLGRENIYVLMNLVNDKECPACKEKYCLDLRVIDLDKHTMKVECMVCAAKYNVDFDPDLKQTKKPDPKKLKWIKEEQKDTPKAVSASIEEICQELGIEAESFEELEFVLIEELEDEEFAKKLKYKDRKKLSDDKFAVVKTVKTKTGKEKKIRMFPIHDEAHVRNALSRLGQKKVKDTLKKLGVSIESVKKKILKRAKELKMDDLLERQNGGNKLMAEEKTLEQYKEEVVTLTTQIEALKTEKATWATEKETLEDAKTQAETAKTDVETERDELKTKVDEFEKEKAKKDEEAKKTKVKEIRDKFGDLAESYDDDELLDDKVQKLLEKEKELADIKSNPKVKEALEISSVDDDKTPDYLKRRRKINKVAYGKESDQ